MHGKFIQITAVPESEEYYGYIYALDDNGKVWRLEQYKGSEHEGWEPLSDERCDK